MSSEQSTDSSTVNVSAVKDELDDDILSDAADAGVNVESIISGLEANVDADLSGYSAGTHATFAQSAIRQAIEAEKADSVTGIALGSRDRYANNWPRKTSLVRSDGDHQKVKSWDGQLPTTTGGEMRIPHGSIVTFGAEYDTEYDARGEWEASQIQSVEDMDHADRVEAMREVAAPASDVSRSDAPSGDKRGKVVCLRGEIRYVNPFPVFEDTGDGVEPVGDGDVLMTDQRGEKQPHFEVVLEEIQGHRVQAAFERQSHGNLYMDVQTDPNDPPFSQILKDAMGLGGPESQTDFVQGVLSGTEVAIIGEVTRVEPDRDDDGNKRVYIDVSCTGMVSIDDAPDEATAESAATDDAESDSESEQTGAEQTPAESEGDSPSATGEPAQTGAQADAAEVASDIETAANLQGADPGNLTVADVKDMAPALADDHPDEVLKHAVKSLSSESDSDGDSAAEDSDSASSDAESGMSALEKCRDGGLYKCPADGCLAQVGEQGVFMDHVEDEHADGPAPEWVAKQTGA